MAANAPRTWGSGNSAPEDVADQRMALLGGLAVLLVLAPIMTVVAWLTYQLGLVVARLRWQMLAAGAGVLVLLWRVLGGSWGTYFTGHRELLRAVKDGTVKTVAADRWVEWLLLEVPTALAFGTLLGAIYSMWRWYRRPVWEADDRRPYPWVKRSTNRVMRQIGADQGGPLTGTTVGVDEITGTRVIQSDAEGGSHTLVTGGSGTGKTTAILMQMRDVIRQGRGLVLIDLKGSDDMPEQIADWCKRYGRVFHHWTFQSNLETYSGPADQLSFYEPVGRGDATRRAGMLLATREWSAEADHYKKIVEGFLQVVFNVIERTAPVEVDAIADVVSLSTDPAALIRRAQELFDQQALSQQVADSSVEKDFASTNARVSASVEWIDNWQYVVDPVVRSLLQSLNSYITVSASGRHSIDETVKQFGQSLNTFKQSIAGRYLDRDPEGLRDIDLSRAAREGHVVVFSLNSSNYPEPAAALGTMIIQDLKTVSSELRGDPEWFRSTDVRDRMHVYIDEFGALKADNTKTLLQQVRDARISVSLSTQSVSDLAYHSPEFKDALLNTVASFLALRPNTQDEAEQLAGLSGAQMRQMKQIGIEQSTSLGGIDTGAATGGGFLREEMGFVIEPHQFQDLRIGEAIYISSGDGARRALKVKVIREDPAACAVLPSPGLAIAPTNRKDVVAPSAPVEVADVLSPSTVSAPAPAVVPLGTGGRPQVPLVVPGVGRQPVAEPVFTPRPEPDVEPDSADMSTDVDTTAAGYREGPVQYEIKSAPLFSREPVFEAVDPGPALAVAPVMTPAAESTPEVAPVPETPATAPQQTGPAGGGPVDPFALPRTTRAPAAPVSLPTSPGRLPTQVRATPPTPASTPVAVAAPAPVTSPAPVATPAAVAPATPSAPTPPAARTQSGTDEVTGERSRVGLRPAPELPRKPVPGGKAWEPPRKKDPHEGSVLGRPADNEGAAPETWNSKEWG